LSFETDPSAAWSVEHRALLERHPRATWPARETPETQFWLGIHDGFRRDSAALTALGQDFRDRRLRAPELAVVAGARLRELVALLQGHHEIEDHHYFPVLREAEPRLARGFDLLARDHVALAEDIHTAVQALGAFTASADLDGGSSRAAAEVAERFVTAYERVHRRLVRHLEDEEDMVIPLLLERA
jgi:hypothetical protein